MRVARRPVTPADEPLLRRIYASTRAEELARVPWTRAQKEAFLRMQFDAQDAHYRAHFPDAAYEVVLVDGEPAGRLYVHRRPDERRVLDVALLPDFRGHGVGGGLLRAVIADAEAAGVPVRVHVERDNPARRLYHRLGFEQVGDAGVYLLLERQVKTAS